MNKYNGRAAQLEAYPRTLSQTGSAEELDLREYHNRLQSAAYSNNHVEASQTEDSELARAVRAYSEMPESD